jgi:NSS family neurotransmitter:Na+ symporter
MQQDRGQWGSTLGFVFAAAGSAIGLGNIWRFPYVTGTNGGAAFIIIYLACVVFICLPYLIAELALGRHTQRNPVGAILKLRPRSPWSLVGFLGVLTGVCILSYYAVIAGWAFGYIFKSALAPAMSCADFTASPLITVPLFVVFIFFTILVVIGGVEHGIERWAKILMPVLLGLMAVVIIRGMTLPGASAGFEFLFKPDFSVVDGKVILAALGQAFFSLSLGMGAMITYGSYLPKSSNLLFAGGSVALFDTLIALLAGLMIFPAVFAMGKDPAEGPPLLFEVLPDIFASMPLGTIVAVVFFILLSIAALTSTVSLLEVVVSYFVDERRWRRRIAVWMVGAIVFVFGLPSVLSQGANTTLSEASLLGNTSFLYIMDFLWGNVSLAVGAFFLSIFVGWVWGTRKAAGELREGGTASPRLLAVWGFFVRWICPAVIVVVMLNLFGVFGE